MNCNRYRTIFSKRLGMLVPVAETTKTHVQGSSAGEGGASRAIEAAAPSRSTGVMRPVVLAVTAALWGQMALASPPLPTGGDITTGTGSITESGNTLTVNQSSQNLAANWQSFDIGADHAVVFNQPNSTSVALNRVIGSDASSIYGSLSANGHVFLVNPNGVLFAPGSQVSAGGLVASTLNISDADFAAGRYRFTDGSGAGSVVNEGGIEAGSVALLGPKVVNSGTINTAGGNTTLAAGDRVTVSMLGGLLTAEVDAAVANAEIQNHGQITADGGRVGLLAGRADSVLDSLTNTDGVIQANSIRNENGRIYLDGGAGGTVTVSGTLDASALNGGDGKGGEVRVLGDHVTLGSGSTVDVSGQRSGGTALIGGDFQGRNPEVHNARLTTVEAGAAIRADGAEQGGRVIVWADDTTQFDGAISALGSGFAEVSGKDVLRFSGKVDTGGGTLLLDPTDITVQSAAGDEVNTFSGGQIATLLADSDVILAADNNVTWDAAAALDYNGTGTRTLTLRAGNNISFNGSISDSVAGSDMLSVVLNADRDASGAGGIAMTNGASIETSGGDIILRGGDAAFAALPSFTDGGYEAALRATAARGILLTGATLDAASGDIAMRGVGVDGGSDGYGVQSSGTVRTSGSGTITADGIGGAGTDENRGIFLIGNSWSTVDGALTLQGIGGGTGIENTGVRLNTSSLVEATGNGNLTVNALGGTGGNYNDGVVGDISSTLRVADGILTVTGTGRGTGFGSDGIELANGTVFEATGSGSINLNGTSIATGANTNRGVTVWISSILRTASGALTVQGTSANPATGAGISVESNGTIGSATQSGALTLTADTMNFAVGAVRGTGILLLQPLTPATTIGLGNSAAGTLNLTSAEIGRLANGFSAITIGRSDSSGAVDVRNAAFLDPVTIRTPAGSGSITVNGPLSTGSGTSTGSITLQAAGDTSLAAAASITTQGQSITLNADQINGSTGTAISTGPGTATVALDAVSGGVNFGDVAIDSDSLLVTGGGDFDLSNAGNAVSIFASSTSGGALTFVNSQGIAIDTVGATQGIGISDGNLTVQTTSADIVLNESVTATGSADITLASAGDFTNNAGASAIALDTGHFQVWSTDPANDVRGGLDYDYKQYNAAYGSTVVLGTGNGFLYTLAPVITASLTGTVSKSYDGTTAATLAAENYDASGAVDGDVVTLNSASSSYTSAGTGGTVARDAATGKTVSVSGIAIDSSVSSAGNGSKTVYGYSLANTTADAAIGVIDPKAVTLTPGDVTKTYDGGTAYTTAAGDLAALTAQLGIAGDTVGTATISYTDKNAGNANKAVTLDSVTVSDGNGGGNYDVTLAGNSTSTINRAVITDVTGITADNKIYDSTTAATLDAGAAGFTGMFGGDSLNVAAADGAFTDKNAGTARAVSISGISLGGADAGNYDLADTTATATADIAKASIADVTGITAENKVYDGTTAATLDTDAAGFTGMFAGDSLSVATASGAFTDKNAGTARTVNISGISLGGADASNYDLAATTATATADVTPATLTVDGVTANDKVYDGTTAATLTTTGHALSGVLMGDAVALNGSSYSALFGDRNAGTGKTVTATGLGLSGADANNYALTQPTGLTADITQRPLTVTAVTNSKTYDGTKSAASTPTVTGELATGDSFTTLAEEYATADVGTDLTLIPLLVIEDGNGGANYALTLVNDTTGEIIRPAVDLSQVGGSYTAASLDNSGKDGRRDQEGADGANGDHGAGSAGVRRRKLDEEYERRVVQVIATGLRLPQGITASALDDFGSFEADNLRR